MKTSDVRVKKLIRQINGMAAILRGMYELDYPAKNIDSVMEQNLKYVQFLIQYFKSHSLSVKRKDEKGPS